MELCPSSSSAAYSFYRAINGQLQVTFDPFDPYMEDYFYSKCNVHVCIQKSLKQIKESRMATKLKIRKILDVSVVQPKTCHHRSGAALLAYSGTGSGTPPGHTEILHPLNL